MWHNKNNRNKIAVKLIKRRKILNYKYALK